MSSDGTVGGIDDAAPVQIAPGQTQYQRLRRGQIAGKGDVVLVAQPGDIGNISHHSLVVGVVEEEYQVEFVVCDPGVICWLPPWA